MAQKALEKLMRNFRQGTHGKDYKEAYGYAARIISRKQDIDVIQLGDLIGSGTFSEVFEVSFLNLLIGMT